MRCFSWKSGELCEGLALTPDEKLGQVIFLGEEGRGRRYEKVAFARRNPADVMNGRVLEAHPLKITLAAKEGMKEKSFYVLEKPRPAMGLVLVRVNTSGGYVRDAYGHWDVVAGTPEVLVQGHGAFGDAGRIGTWADGILVFREGDVLRVTESRSEGVRWALWISDGRPVTATWQDYENLQAVSKAEAVIAEAEEKPEALPIAFGSMSCFTYSGSSKIESGIKVDKGATGPVVALGEEGRGRKLAEVPIVGFAPGERLDVAAVAVLSEKEIAPRYSSDKPKIVRIYGLIESSRVEAGAVLVRLKLPHRNRVHSSVKLLRGNPMQIAAGNFAGGIAGNADSAPDEFYVLREGDALVTGTYEYPWRVVSLAGGQLTATPWEAWEEADGRANPAAYIAKGKAPWNHVPAEWVGRVVSVLAWVREYDSRSREDVPELQEIKEGELISVSPLTLNLGWNGRDRVLVTINSGVWVRLDAEKVVALPDATRETVQAEVVRLRAAAEQVRMAGHFTCLEPDLQKRIDHVAFGREIADWSSDPIHFLGESTESIQRWIERAEAVFVEARAASAAAEILSARQVSGEVLVEFGGPYRWAATGNRDFWVLLPDGSERVPDEHTVRSRGRGEDAKKWHLVGPDELALTWSKDCTAAPHEFAVVKLPVGGVTSAQIEIVSRIEDTIRASYDGAVGMSGRTSSPPVGEGWGLRKKSASASTPAAPIPEETSATPLSVGETVDFREQLRKKFGGGAR